MPLYEYECRDCQGRFERRQAVHEDPVSVCPECGGAVRRVLFPVGIIFKGSGFYVTDSRSPNPAGANGNGNGNGESSKPKEESAPAAKPAVDSAAKESKETAAAKA